MIALVVNATVLAIRQFSWPERYRAPNAQTTIQQSSYPQQPPQPPPLTRKQELEIENEAAAQRARPRVRLLPKRGLIKRTLPPGRKLTERAAQARQKAADAREKAAQDAALAARKAAEDAAAAHERYLATYVNTGFARKRGVVPVGVVFQHRKCNGERAGKRRRSGPSSSLTTLK